MNCSELITHKPFSLALALYCAMFLNKLQMHFLSVQSRDSYCTCFFSYCCTFTLPSFWCPFSRITVEP